MESKSHLKEHAENGSRKVAQLLVTGNISEYLIKELKEMGIEARLELASSEYYYRLIANDVPVDALRAAVNELKGIRIVQDLEGRVDENGNEKEVAFLAEGGAVEVFEFFMIRRGIIGQIEMLDDGKYIVRSKNATSEELSKQLQTHHGLVLHKKL